ADHHEPAGDAGGVRDDQSARGGREAHCRRPRSAGVGALQGGGARNRQAGVTGPGAFGHVKLNRAPRPFSDSTETRPPFDSTIFFTRASSTPVPSVSMSSSR